jgi:DNA-binding MarR family transcriptional regulator
MPAGRLPERDVDARVLGHVFLYPGLTAHAIARALRYTYPSCYGVDRDKAARSLARLAAAGLVTAEPGLVDGRERQIWRLTDAT